MAQLDFGEQVYSYQTPVFDQEFKKDNLFYIHGANSICTRTDLGRTRDELIEMGDRYRYDENDHHLGDDEDDDEDDFALNEAQLRRNNEDRGNLVRRGDEDRKGGKDQQGDLKKLYRVKKYSILCFKTRRVEQLTRKEELDKIDNRVCVDMVRSGAALIRVLRHREAAQIREAAIQNRYTTGLKFIRRPLYYMYVPTKFINNNHCKKFLEFRSTRWFKSSQAAPNRALTMADYDCLYVKRLKKVVLRSKIFKQSLLLSEKILALERVNSKGQVVNLDDPVQRDPYYNRLFKLSTPTLKKFLKVKLVDFHNNRIPKSKQRPTHYFLLDFTTRTRGVAKSDSFSQGAKYMGYKDRTKISEEGNTMECQYLPSSMKKVMERGQPSRFEALPRHQRYIRDGDYNMDRYQIFMNNLIYGIRGSGLYKVQNDEKNDLRFHFRYAWKDSTSDRTREYYVKKTLFFELGSWNHFDVHSDDKDGKVYFHVIKGGEKSCKKLFSFGVKAGSKIAFDPHFRRLYLLEFEEGRLGLRVISYDAIAKCINQYL